MKRMFLMMAIAIVTTLQVPAQESKPSSLRNSGLNSAQGNG